MSRSDRALVVIVGTALLVGIAGLVKWRDHRFVEVAQSLDACDVERAFERKTSSLGRPSADERTPAARVVTWRRNGRLLTVSLVTPPRRTDLVVGVVRLELERDRAGELPPTLLYEDRSGLRVCKW